MVCFLDVQNSETKKCLVWMSHRLHHANIAKFCGVAEIGKELFLVSEHCPKGTLSDVVQNEKYAIDDNIKYSLALDIASGMSYLHGQGIIHAMLTPEHCSIDRRWGVKITDWEYYKLQSLSSGRKISQVSPLGFKKTSISDRNIQARALLWTAPEILCSHHSPFAAYTKQADVYSYAIILVEIFTREDPYSELQCLMEPLDIIEAVRDKAVRPNIKELNSQLQYIISQAWHQSPKQRPSYTFIRKYLHSIKPSRKSVMDCMMEAIEQYVHTLEDKVQERTAELAAINTNLQQLLHQILPPSVADRLSSGQAVKPESAELVTIFFSDIVGFTSLSAVSSPLEIVTLLNDLYTTFDLIIDRHDVYKVETIGDAYMVISGLPNKNGVMHVYHIAMMALDFLSAVESFQIAHRPGEQLRLREGIHSGPVVAGVVGSKMPRYCLFGDTVNTASRMESSSLPMKIQMSEASNNLLQSLGGFITQKRGPVNIKGKGKMTTYFLMGRVNQ